MLTELGHHGHGRRPPYYKLHFRLFQTQSFTRWASSELAEGTLPTPFGNQNYKHLPQATELVLYTKNIQSYEQLLGRRVPDAF